MRDGIAKNLFLFAGPIPTRLLQAVATDLGQDLRRGISAHDRDSGIGPHPQESGIVGSAAHAIVPCAKTAANDNGQFGHLGTGNRVHQLRTVPPTPGSLLIFVKSSVELSMEVTFRNSSRATARH